MIYSARWKDGRLICDQHSEEWIRISLNEKVILKYLYNSQNITDETLNNKVYKFSLIIFYNN